MRESTKNVGLVYLFTGDGKGKTSAALGIVLRALAHGWRVGWISWYKEANWGISEHKLADILNVEAQKRLTFIPMGKGFYLSGKKSVKANTAVIIDKTTLKLHKQVAIKALEKAKELLPKVDVLVLDEVCNAVNDKLLDASVLKKLLKERQATHIILTGRNAEALYGVVDLVSEINSKKHPFEQGKMAIQGLDF